MDPSATPVLTYSFCYIMSCPKNHRMLSENEEMGKKEEIIIYKLNTQVLVSQGQVALSFCSTFLTWDRCSFEYESVFGVHLTTMVATYMLNWISLLELHSPHLVSVSIMSAKMQASLGGIIHWMNHLSLKAEDSGSRRKWGGKKMKKASMEIEIWEYELNSSPPS